MAKVLRYLKGEWVAVEKPTGCFCCCPVGTDDGLCTVCARKFGHTISDEDAKKLLGDEMAEKFKFKEIEVTIKRRYFIPMQDNKQHPESTKIDGLSFRQVVVAWFKNHSLYQTHATRDSYIVGGSDKVIKVVDLDTGEEIKL